MYILLTGLSHHTTPVQVREKFAFSTSEIEGIYKRFRQQSPLEGIFILTTCNRTEVYAVARSIEVGQQYMREYLSARSGLDDEQLFPYVYQKNCYAAVEHLFNVASGLDSMVLGETQILNQLKETFSFAQQSGATNGILNQLFQKAVAVGKKVRTRTDIDKHPVSISYIAVELARELLGDMSNKMVLVVGAGETGELATRHLKSGGIKTVRVTNRSYDKAVALAENFGGRVVRFDDMPQELSYADIVISCTAASHYVICGDACRQALIERRGKDIVFIDIAVPRDVDPDFSSIEGVHIYDIDRLQNVSDNSYEARRMAAEQAREIIAQELEEFNIWLNQLSVAPVLGALTQKGEGIRQQELRRAMNRLGQVSEREERVISDMGHAIVNQLLRSPIHMIKEMALCEQGHTFAEMVKKLFELELAMEEHNEYADT